MGNVFGDGQYKDYLSEVLNKNINAEYRGYENLDPEFLKRLKNAINSYGIRSGLPYNSRTGKSFVLGETLRSPEREQLMMDTGRAWVNKPTDSIHVQGKAADVYILNDGKVSNNPDDYKLLHEVFEENGLDAVGGGKGQTWGGDPKTMDLGHMELPKNDSDIGYNQFKFKTTVEPEVKTSQPEIKFDSKVPEKFSILDFNKNGHISDDLLKVGLGVVGAAALGYAGHKLYKHFKNKRKDMSEQSLGRFTAYRILGVDFDNSYTPKSKKTADDYLREAEAACKKDPEGWMKKVREEMKSYRGAPDHDDD